eukprot:scaffold408_cov71-Cylindrotheca_fusiformis.AAC.13
METPSPTTMTKKELYALNQDVSEESRVDGNCSRDVEFISEREGYLLPKKAEASRRQETKEDYELSVKRLDQLEDAARRIQQTFRLKKSEQGIHRSVAKKSLIWDLDDHEESDTSENTSDNETTVEREEGQFFTLFFIALGSLGMMAFSTFSCCFKKLFGNSTEDDVAAGVTDFPNTSSTQHSVQQTASNAVQPATPVNGSGGASPPQPGGVASMAASSAASSVAVGLSSGISAGAAAAATTGGLAGALAATSTTQIIAAVTVAAAVGATVSSAGITSVSSVLPSMVSSCGVVDPDTRTGNFTLSLEGLQRGIADRETFLFENLVVSAYNNLTRGSFDEVTEQYQCGDRYLREMQQSSMLRQVYVGQDATADGISKLQIDLEAVILCKDCPAILPIFGTIEEERLRRRNLRILEQKEVFDVSFIEAYLKTVVEALFELMNLGELPLSFAPSMVYFRPFQLGRSPELNATLDSKEMFEVTIPVATYYDRIKGEILPIFPTQSVNGELDVDFYEGHFEMAIAGFGLTRNFTDEEIMLIEDLFVVAYNQQHSETTNTSAIREMARAILANQVFTPGDIGTEATLDIAFKAFITCQGCPEDEPLFGEMGDHNKLDLDLIQGMLKDVVLGVIGLINSGDLPPSFVPSEVYYIDEESNSTDLAGIPVMTNVDENGTIVVDFPDVGLSAKIYNDEFQVSFRGFAREFNEVESRRFAELLVKDYNGFINGNEDSSLNLREMFQTAIAHQDFSAGDESTSSELDVTLDVSVICQDCPESQPVFGLTNGGDGEGLLYWTFIEAVLPSVISSMVEDIRSGALQSSFLPEGVVRIDDSDSATIAYLDDTTGQIVLEYVPHGPAVPSISMSPSISSSSSPSPSLSVLPSSVPSTTPSISREPSLGPTGFPSETPSNRPSHSAEPSILPSATPSTSALPSVHPSLIPTISSVPTQTPTVRASRVPTKIPSVSPTPVPTNSPTSQPTPTPSSGPTAVPTSAPTQTPSESPSAVPTSAPSSSPTSEPSETPSLDPTSGPTKSPTTAPTSEPTTSPTMTPTETLSVYPTLAPTRFPTMTPTSEPTTSPTMTPIETLSVDPTLAPTSEPTLSPTIAPTETLSVDPTLAPTRFPTLAPTSEPTTSPTMTPTETLSVDPTLAPTRFPTLAPTSVPTLSPTIAPTGTPSLVPTLAPTEFPTESPTGSSAQMPSSTPSVTEGRWTVCGAHKNYQNSCAGIESEVTPADVTVVNGSPLVVRCCSTEATPGFEKRKGGGISPDCPYTASELGGTCYENVDYLTAESICADANGRLCTAAELADGCATGSGCEFDTRRVWTSDTADVVVPL